jgi:hypothetical protein
LPDLTVTAPLTIRHYAGVDHMHFRIRITNLGSATAAPFYVRVNILKGMSPNSPVSCWWLYGPFQHTFDDGETVGLHGKSFLEWDVPFPTSFLQGQAFIQRAVTVKIDPQNTVNESNETNNNFYYDKTGTNFPKQSTFPVGDELQGGEVPNNNP